MKKNGFTLVELLAVISILAVLVLISMPSIIKLYNRAREKSFQNEVETVKVELEKETFNSSLKGEKIPEVYSSFGENQLNMDGRELEYYAEMNADGSIKYLEVSDGQYYYQCKENEECHSVSLKEDDPSIKMDYIKENMATEKVFVYDTLYNIYDSSNVVPVIMTNVGEFDVKVNVSYNEEILNTFVLPKNTIDHMVFIKFDNKMFSSLPMNSVDSLKIDTETIIGKDLDNEDIVVKFPYSNKVKFQKIDSEMIITSISTTTNNDKIAFNQSGVFIPKNVDIGTLTVNVKNQSNKTFKFLNIKRDELVENVEGQINNKSYKPVRLSAEETQKYEKYLMGGIYFYNLTNNSFDMTFDSQENIQKIHFDFAVFINPGVYQEGNISISSKENSNEKQFGSFSPFPINATTTHGNAYCKNKNVCFGDALFNYEDGKLIMGSGFETAALNKSQSMGVDNTYSVYMTIKPTTLQQIGLPAGHFPGTILAISEANTKYLSWIGIYNGYLQVYSYYNGESRSGQRGNETVTGFTSFDISSYEGKTMNIQITARRGHEDISKNITRVYINGNKVKEFNSGITPVDYSIATIGDLRPSRGLKYEGKIYDLALYNTELSADAVRHNWNYAKDKWNIN